MAKRDGQAAKFDSSGSQILLKQLELGQNLGDLSIYDFDEYGGNYFEWDKGPDQRLNIFDREFNLKSTSELRAKPSEGRFVMRIDRSGNPYFICSVRSPIMRGVLDEIPDSARAYPCNDRMAASGRAYPFFIDIADLDDREIAGLAIH